MKKFIGLVVFIVFLIALCVPMWLSPAIIEATLDSIGLEGLVIGLLVYVAMITCMTVWVFIRLK